MVQDPVCKMYVDESETDFRLSYEQHDYFFCSQGCMAEFERHAEDYISSVTPCCGEMKRCADSFVTQDEK